MATETKKVLVKFNQASTDDTAKGNLVKRGFGISTESRGVWIRTETDAFYFLPSGDYLNEDGAAMIGIDSSVVTQDNVKAALEAHQTTLNGLGSLATKHSISDADVAANAGISWSKISKTGAAASDVGAAPVVDGKIPSQYIPSVALTDIFEVSSQAQMLALEAQVGDYAIRSDENKKYMLKAEPASTLSNWIVINDGGAVLSVDGRTGVVTLGDLYKPIGYLPAWSEITDKPSTFTPSAHTHVWAEITDKPLTFTPSSHSHAISDVTGLQSALDGKQPLAAKLTNLVNMPFFEGALIRVYADGNFYLDSNAYSTTSHTHTTFGALTLTGALGGTTGTFSGAVSSSAFTEGGVSLATKYALAGHTHTTFGAVQFSGDITFDADFSRKIGTSTARALEIWAQDVRAEGFFGGDATFQNIYTKTHMAYTIGQPAKRFGSGYFGSGDFSGNVLVSGVLNAVTLQANGVDVTSLFATAGHTHTTFGALTLSGALSGTTGSFSSKVAGAFSVGAASRSARVLTIRSDSTQLQLESDTYDYCLRAFAGNGSVTFYTGATGSTATWMTVTGLNTTLEGNLTVKGSTSLVALTLTGALGGTTGTFSGAVSSSAFTEGGVSLATKYALAGHTHTAFGALTLSGDITLDSNDSRTIGSSSLRLANVYSTLLNVSGTATMAGINASGVVAATHYVDHARLDATSGGHSRYRRAVDGNVRGYVGFPSTSAALWVWQSGANNDLVLANNNGTTGRIRIGLADAFDGTLDTELMNFHSSGINALVPLTGTSATFTGNVFSANNPDKSDVIGSSSASGWFKILTITANAVAGQFASYNEVFEIAQTPGTAALHGARFTLNVRYKNQGGTLSLEAYILDANRSTERIRYTTSSDGTTHTLTVAILKDGYTSTTVRRRFPGTVAQGTITTFYDTTADTTGWLSPETVWLDKFRSAGQTVTSPLTLSSTLSVAGNATFSQNVTVNSNLTANGALLVNGSKVENTNWSSSTSATLSLGFSTHIYIGASFNANWTLPSNAKDMETLLIVNNSNYNVILNYGNGIVGNSTITQATHAHAIYRESDNKWYVSV